MAKYTDWRKASYSNGSGQCIEAASADETVVVRDTTNRAGGALAFTASAWAKFTAALR